MLENVRVIHAKVENNVYETRKFEIRNVPHHLKLVDLTTLIVFYGRSILEKEELLTESEEYDIKYYNDFKCDFENEKEMNSEKDECEDWILYDNLKLKI